MFDAQDFRTAARSIVFTALKYTCAMWLAANANLYLNDSDQLESSLATLVTVHN